MITSAGIPPVAPPLPLSSKSARRILDVIKERSPYIIKAIQIDGGSEFKAEF